MHEHDAEPNLILISNISNELWMDVGQQKGTKNALETGRTFATLFADMDLRLQLLGARTEFEFKQLMWEYMKDLAEEQCIGNASRKQSEESTADKVDGLSTHVCNLPRSVYAVDTFLRPQKYSVFLISKKMVL